MTSPAEPRDPDTNEPVEGDAPPPTPESPEEPTGRHSLRKKGPVNSTSGPKRAQV